MKAKWMLEHVYKNQPIKDGFQKNPWLLQFLSGVFKRGRNYELKITEDMLYGTEDYQQPSPTMSRSYTKVG